ncbi:MAG: biopolymer transporter ExbD [Deltaproteobacteria bacterium]|nr:biopolymer transporter ExbD [Deltaproteobacteria bacterium]
MLVLLVIFMVTAPMLERGIDVNLPKVEAGAVKKTREEPLIITIDRAGDIFIETRRLTLSELGIKLNAIFENRADQVVYLRADEKVPYGVVARTMAEVRRSGIERIAMITEPAGE